MDDLLYKIGLTMIPKVGPVIARQLLSYTGAPEEVFRSPVKTLLKIPGVGPSIAQAIRNPEVLLSAEKELEAMQRHGVQGIFFTDEAYPGRLRHLSDSPLMLFFAGGGDLNPERCVSVIGTRKPSPYGIAFCEEFLQGLWEYKPTIVSGLAYGIDIAAHRKAMELGFPTIGVMAHGHGHCYPSAHRSIAQKMTAEGGLLSEYPFHTAPEKEHFPLRNRIVAGLCDALLVVETGLEGGSLITAQFANDYNKDVFAVPGRVKDPHSAGCNHLIKTHRAALLESAEDFILSMRWDDQVRKHAVQQQLFTELEPEEKKIVDLLRQYEEAGIDLLSAASTQTPSELAATLLGLEFKGIVKSLPGKRFALLAV